MKFLGLLTFIILPLGSAILCATSNLWLKVSGFVILLIVQRYTWHVTNRNNKKLEEADKKIQAYDRLHQTQYDENGDIKGYSTDYGTF